MEHFVSLPSFPRSGRAALLGLALTLSPLPLVSPVLAAGADRPAAAPTAGAERIAAVINQDAVSLRDLNARMDIVMATSRLPNTPEIRQRLAPQILRALIDETLKLQEVERVKISVGPEDIEQGVKRLEGQNGLPPGGLRKAFKEAGLDWGSMERQVRAEMGWIKVVQKTLVPRVNVSDEEVTIYENNLKRNLGQPEYLVADIFLAVDDPAQDADVQSAGARLIDQLRQGANFAALARQFSRGPTAQKGGDLGWVGPGDVDQDLLGVLGQMAPGNLSQPIRTFGGYHILLLRDRRLAGQQNTSAWPMSRLVLITRGPQAVKAEVRQNAEARLKDIRGCEAFDVLAREIGPPSGPLGPVDPQRLPPPIRDAVRDLPVGQPSPRLSVEGAEVVMMVCDRPTGGLPDRNALHERLAQQKLEGLAQRRLRDLRQQALIDVRI